MQVAQASRVERPAVAAGLAERTPFAALPAEVCDRIAACAGNESAASLYFAHYPFTAFSGLKLATVPHIDDAKQQARKILSSVVHPPMLYDELDRPSFHALGKRLHTFPLSVRRRIIDKLVLIAEHQRRHAQQNEVAQKLHPTYETLSHTRIEKLAEPELSTLLRSLIQGSPYNADGLALFVDLALHMGPAESQDRTRLQLHLMRWVLFRDRAGERTREDHEAWIDALRRLPTADLDVISGVASLATSSYIADRLGAEARRAFVHALGANITVMNEYPPRSNYTMLDFATMLKRLAEFHTGSQTPDGRMNIARLLERYTNALEIHRQEKSLRRNRRTYSDDRRSDDHDWRKQVDPVMQALAAPLAVVADDALTRRLGALASLQRDA